MKKWLKQMVLYGLVITMVVANSLVIYADEEETEYIPEGVEFCICEDPDNYRIDNKDATCTEYGYQNASMCDACGKFMSYTHFDPPRGHRPRLYAIERATITKDGKSGYRCSWYDCGIWLGGETFVIPRIGKLTATDKTYNGKDQQTDVSVTDANGDEIGRQYYEFDSMYYFGTIFGRDVGVYDIDITFCEWEFYEGKLSTTWKINPKGTNISSVSAAKKKLTVRWKKQKKQTTGYEIQVATNKKFTKNVKTTTVNKKKTSTSFQKLKTKKNYYVRIRTYKNTPKGTCYSDWSKVVKKKTK